MSLRSTSCCGVYDYHGLRNFATPESCIRDIIKSGTGYAFLILTDTHDLKHLIPLEKYIKDYRLGTTTRTPIQTNPNSKNPLGVLIWGIDHPALMAWDISKLYAKPPQNIIQHQVRRTGYKLLYKVAKFLSKRIVYRNDTPY